MPAMVPASASAIQIRQVSKHYGKLQPVNQVSLEIRPGEIFGLIGPNGAGKSTLFKMMLGLIKPDSGDILINGTAVSGRQFREIRRQIGYLPENIVLYDNLTGLETVEFFARLKGMDKRHCPALLEQVGLGAAMHKPMREYSKGMRQRLGFAQALIGKPSVLFLDEPTNGLDPVAIRHFYSVLHDLKEHGVTIIITSHILAELQERVDRLAILFSGQVQALGSIAELREQMHMPLRIELDYDVTCIHADTAMATVLQTLDNMPGVSYKPHARGLAVNCSQAAKMQVLATAMLAGRHLRNMDIRNSSLEDLFFGLTD